MTEVISFISRKGGTGKTTNAIMIATALEYYGYKVAMVETDTNYTLGTLRKMELHKKGLKEDKHFPILASTDSKIDRDIKKLKRDGGYSHIIIDSAGKTTDSHIKELCLVSDMVVVPTSLTQNDLLVAYQTIEDLKPAVKLNSELRLCVLPSRVHSRTKVQTVIDTLSNLDAEIIPAYVPQKNVFTQFSTMKHEKEYLPVIKAMLNVKKQKK